MPLDGDHERALEEFTPAVDQKRAAFADTTAAFHTLEVRPGTGAAARLQRMGELQQGVEEALRLTRRGPAESGMP